ncbi:hypothetical protein AMECASPLE_009375, partial [Ameca splendens]
RHLFSTVFPFAQYDSECVMNRSCLGEIRHTEKVPPAHTRNLSPKSNVEETQTQPKLSE